jgi:predicted phage-related endonuclease
MIRRVPMYDDSYDEWLANRMRYVNASEMATVCGEAGYASLAELYAEKKGLRPPRADNAAMKRGRWGEAAVFQALADTYPEWTVKRARIHCLDDDRRIAATPDGFARAPDREGFGLIETKVVARSIFRDKWLEFDGDDLLTGPATVPVGFRIQTATTRMLNADQCPWAVLAVLIVGEFDWTLRKFEIEPDPALEERIVYCADQFIRNHLDPGIMPPFDMQRDEKLVRLLYPKDDGTEIDLSADNRALAAVEEMTEIKAAISRMSKMEDALKTELTAKLGEHTYGLLADGRRLSWKMQHSKGYTVEPRDVRILRIIKAAKTEAA